MDVSCSNGPEGEEQVAPHDPDLCENEMKEYIYIYSHTQIYGNKHSDTVNSYSIK